ncbi:MAG: FecR family protein [Cellvibrionaceae bacterium]
MLRLKFFLLFFIIQPILVCFSSQASAEHWLYAFRPGDTLWSICRQFTTRPNCWQTIGQENGVDFPRQIPPGTVIKFPISWLKTIPKPVTINYVRGNVNFSDSNSELSAASVGDNLAIGTIITVGEDSNATLKFADGTVMLLEANSELHLNALSANGDTGMVDSRVRLNRGAATTQVPQRRNRIRFSIETPSAVAAVRGTEFRVSTDKEDVNLSRAEVLEGLVGVDTSVSGQDVNQGFGLTAEKGTAPSEPIKLLPPPVFITTNQPQFEKISIEWQEVPNAKKYRTTLLSNTNNEKEILFVSETNEASVLWPNLSVSCYSAEVSAIDENKLIGMPAHLNICTEATLAQVQINKVKKKNKTTLEATWINIENASSYKVEYSLSNDFKDAKTITTTTNSAQISIDTELEYFIRVTAENASGLSSPTSLTAHWSPTFWDKYIGIGAAGIILLLIVL